MRFREWAVIAGFVLQPGFAFAQVGPVTDAPPPPPCRETQATAAVAAWNKPVSSAASSAHDPNEARTHLVPLGSRSHLKLAQKDSVRLPVAPGGPPQPASYMNVGLVGFTVPKDGTYRVLTSEGMRIDVVVNSTLVQSTSFGRGVACDGKHVDFPLKAGLAVLQLAGAPYDAVDVLIIPAE